MIFRWANLLTPGIKRNVVGRVFEPLNSYKVNPAKELPQMYCSKCGTEIPATAVFCLHCGFEVRDSKQKNKNSVHSSKRGATTGLAIGATVFVVGLLLIAGLVGSLYLYNQRQDDSSDDRGSRPLISRDNPIRQPERMTIVNKSFPVGAHQYVYYTVPLKSGDAHVTGHFTAQGGGNDIEVLVLDQDGFTNFSNGHNASTYYNSGGYVTAGTIDLNLRPATYYIVFNNAKALLTNKVVTAEIDAEY
jgi:hypothetical protein